jgi:hypothetical protein
MSDGTIIRLHCDRCSDVPVDTGVNADLATVLPLRAASDRRGQYKELRAFIDAGLNVEVTFDGSNRVTEPH